MNALDKAKTNEAIRIDKIPKEIIKNNSSTELLSPGPYAAYIVLVIITFIIISEV